MHRRWSSLVAALAVVGLLASAASAQTTGELREQLDDRRTQRADAQERLDRTRQAEGDARERLAEADRQLDAALAELARVEDALATATEARDRATAEAERLRRELATVEAELGQAEVELAVVQGRFQARVAGAFKRGATATETALVGQLLGASDIAEALSTAPFLTAVMDADRRLVDDVQQLLEQVQGQRAEAAQLRVSAEREAREAAARATEVAERAAEQRTLSRSVAAKRAEREAALQALSEDRRAIESHLAGLDAESSRISDQLAAIAAEQARQAAEAAAAEAARRAAEEAAARDRASGASGGPAGAPTGGSSGGSDGGSDAGDGGGSSDGGDPPVSVGGWTRPVGGALTSPFGPRWGRNHNGVDLAGSVGTGVVASQPGTVVGVTSSCHPTSSFGCGGGFGNHVVVSHAAGMATVYAHLSTVGVGVGQAVGAGQYVGAVGNSGNSYGAHLHFEVRDGGVPRDPCGYIAC